METEIVLECRNICKSFGTNQVLKDVSLSAKKGEVHAILGTNGAGKSTLVKIITGVYKKNSGEILIDGEAADIKTPQDSEHLGIAIIHQDQQMVPLFDVTRNAFVGSEITKKGGILDIKTMSKLVQEQLDFIHADFDASRQITTLSVGQREQVAIVSALLKKPKILILDEPTASLSSKEIDRLFEVIRIMKRNGVTVIYISHHLNEVFEIADSITVLRDSRVQTTLPVSEADQKSVVALMIGKELKDFYPKEKVPIGDEVLKIISLHSGSMVNGVDLVLHKGEILGLAGLVGAGRTETMLALYGAAKVDSGEIWMDGQKFIPKSPKKSTKAGIALIPEDRRTDGVILPMSIAENLSLASTKLWARHGIIQKARSKLYSKRIMDELAIQCTGDSQDAGDLSGGNQQKVVIGKWLFDNYKVFIFDQPTTGVDVGAKTEIYRKMVELAKKGCGILFISSENEELLGICDRIDVMYKGRIIREFKAEEATEKDLLYWSTGGSAEEETA